MTAGEAIKMADELRPNNSFSDEMKQLWLRQADSACGGTWWSAATPAATSRGAARIFCGRKGWNIDTPLLADNAAGSALSHWLAAQMDLALGETAGGE
mgnify:CR=1 FL=1